MTLVSAGKYKTEHASNAPLTPEAKAALQKTIDGYYTMFVNAVSKGRGVSAASVRSGFGEGRCLMANDALKAAMIDGIATLDEVISKMRTKGSFPVSANVSRAALALSLSSKPIDINKQMLRELQLSKMK